MARISYWEKKSFFSDVDVTVIGSGIVGLSAAIELKTQKPNLNVIILERGALPSGASTKNAGFACFGSPSELLDDLSSSSEESVLGLVEKRWNGLQNLRQLLGDEALSFHQNGSYELFSNEDQRLYGECEEQLPYLNQLLYPLFKQDVFQVDDESVIKFGFHGVTHAIKNIKEGQIDTGKMMNSLLKMASNLGIRIINGTAVEALDELAAGVQIKLQGFEFFTRNVIVATNGFARQIISGIELKPARAQVLVTKPIRELKVDGVFHMDKGYYYFRNVENRILLGGGRNLALEEETTTEIQTTSLIQNKLDQLLEEVILPGVDYEVDMRWAGIMGVGDSKKTIVRQHSDHVYISVRMGGMGVAIGSLIGKEVAELLMQR